MMKSSIYVPSVANNKSAKKRIQIAERNRLINKSYKSTIKTFTKKTLENCEKFKKDPNDEDVIPAAENKPPDKTSNVPTL